MRAVERAAQEYLAKVGLGILVVVGSLILTFTLIGVYAWWEMTFGQGWERLTKPVTDCIKERDAPSQ